MKFFIVLIFLLINFGSIYSQNTSTLILISNENSSIYLDADSIGILSSDIPKKIEINAGEHYLQVKPLSKSGTEKNKILNLKTGSQQVLKFEFNIDDSPETITIAEVDFTIPGSIVHSETSNTPTFYYALEKGDILKVDLEMINEKGTNSLSIFSYPDNYVLYTKDNFQDLNETIQIKKRGIYGLSFKTYHTFPRDMKMKISRTPSSHHTIDFVTKVISKDFHTSKVIQPDQSFYINSGSNATFKNGKSRICLAFSLPQNTIRCYYSFSASRESSNIKSTEKKLNLLSQISSLIDNTGSLSFGVNQLTQAPGSNYCDIYLIDANNHNTFLAKEPFQYFPSGSRENYKSGIVELPLITNTAMYLGVRNPDSMYGININIEIVAIVNETKLIQAENN